MENQSQYNKAFVVIRAISLEELAEKLTDLSDECWSITVIKTVKIGNEYETLVKTVTIKEEVR